MTPFLLRIFLLSSFYVVLFFPGHELCSELFLPSHVWSLNKTNQTLERVTSKRQRLQLPLPIHIDGPITIFPANQYVAFASQEHASIGSRFFGNSKTEAVDLWLYSASEARWIHLPKVLPNPPKQWINLFCAHSMLIIDFLLEPKESAEDPCGWIRLHINLETNDLRSLTILPGTFQQVAVKPDPSTGVFRYAYILKHPRELIKYDMLRKSQLEVTLPHSPQNLEIQPLPKEHRGHREDDIILKISAPHAPTLMYQGTDLSPLPSHHSQE